MTREIKFRVRDRKSKQFIGYECLMPDITNDGWRWAKSYGGKDWEDGIYYEAFDNSYLIREQYTGLKDKNGKEIYEGDVVRNIHGFNRVVGWALEGKFTNVAAPEELEIIGNIYENPELLPS